MINVSVYRNNNGEIYGIKADDHGDSIVCAAISALIINAVNSISELTDENFSCDYNDKGGYLFLNIPEIEKGINSHDVNLLLNSLVLGLNGIMTDNPEHLNVKEEAR